MRGTMTEIDPRVELPLLTLGARLVTPPGRVAPRTLAAIAEGLGNSLPIEPLAFSGDGQRRYTRLLETRAYEAWLIAWTAGSDLELHDHGGSEGVLHVVEGTLVEARTDLAARGPLETQDLLAGATRPVAVTTVHRVWNRGPEHALSVHVYSPPLTSMTFFDDSREAFLAPLRTELIMGSPEGGPQ